MPGRRRETCEGKKRSDRVLGREKLVRISDSTVLDSIFEAKYTQMVICRGFFLLFIFRSKRRLRISIRFAIRSGVAVVRATLQHLKRLILVLRVQYVREERERPPRKMGKTAEKLERRGEEAKNERKRRSACGDEEGGYGLAYVTSVARSSTRRQGRTPPKR